MPRPHEGASASQAGTARTDTKCSFVGTQVPVGGGVDSGQRIPMRKFAAGDREFERQIEIRRQQGRVDTGTSARDRYRHWTVGDRIRGDGEEDDVEKAGIERHHHGFGSNDGVETHSRRPFGVHRQLFGISTAVLGE